MLDGGWAKNYKPQCVVRRFWAAGRDNSKQGLPNSSSYTVDRSKKTDNTGGRGIGEKGRQG